MVPFGPLGDIPGWTQVDLLNTDSYTTSILVHGSIMNVSEEAMSMFVCGGGVEKKKKIITKLTYDVNKS